MSKRSATRPAAAALSALPKVRTGIGGFDQVTDGGLPEGRTSILCGAAGCGKTLFAMQFLVRGALDHGEPGIFVAFEETEEDLVKNVASLGFDLRDLARRKLLVVDHVRVERSEIEENGEYDLEGLFIRLDLAIRTVGAKRLVIDTLEAVFCGLSSHGVLRSELRRLFRWLSDRGVTTIVTAERGDGSLTRNGLEEYVSDCVVLLDHRVCEQVSTRRLRIVKYRGSTHGANEYPFLIDREGLSVVPITGSDLDHVVSSERVSSGVPGIDEMLGGGGYYRGSTVLVTGTAGAGKSSVAAHFAAATCAAGRRCLYVSYEESAKQIERNMASIGLDLATYVGRGLLKMVAHRPTSFGLEGHLSILYRMITEFDPQSVVIDPIGTMVTSGAENEAHLMLVRLIDLMKTRGITAFLTSLTHGGSASEATDVAISSLVDTWLLVQALETNGERTRGMYVIKSRGMHHSNQIREFLLTSKGIVLEPPYVGTEGVLTGTARVVQEARDAAALRLHQAQRLHTKRLIDRKRAVLEQRIEELRAGFAAEEVELLAGATQTADGEEEVVHLRERMTTMRSQNGSSPHGPPVRRRKSTSREEGAS